MMMMTEVGFDYFDYGDVADLHAGCDDNNDHNDEWSCDDDFLWGFLIFSMLLDTTFAESIS